MPQKNLHSLITAKALGLFDNLEHHSIVAQLLFKIKERKEGSLQMMILIVVVSRGTANLFCYDSSTRVLRVLEYLIEERMNEPSPPRRHYPL